MADFDQSAMSDDDSQSNTQNEEVTTKGGHVGLRFCQLCSSMLVPKEDRERRVLQFACRYDEYVEDARAPMIYQNNLVAEVQDQLSIVKDDVINDPTLQRSYSESCAKCAGTDAVFFQVHQGVQAKLALIFVCTSCKYKWMG
jgi:DNA-directed RNA polymerase II subunit RPB9